MRKEVDKIYQLFRMLLLNPFTDGNLKNLTFKLKHNET